MEGVSPPNPGLQVQLSPCQVRMLRDSVRLGRAGDYGGAAVAVNPSEMPNDLIAMPAAAAARFAGVSERQLRYWDATDLLSPGIQRAQPSEYRPAVHLPRARRTARHREPDGAADVPSSYPRGRPVPSPRGHKAPLRELRFSVTGKELFFQRPDGTWAGDRQPDQIVIDATISLPLGSVPVGFARQLRQSDVA